MSETDPTVAATEPQMAGEGGDITGYQLGPLIGRGGMGEVVLAHDPDIGRDVALKRMKAATPELVERFLREARIQARLDHPAIVPVHDLGRDDEGRPFFTMKRVTGTTLEKQIETEKLQRLLRAFVEVCLAIDFAHARGVVHRDLKPSNIMLGDYGEVYVLDWGVARVLDDQGGEARLGDTPPPPSGGMTQAGAVLGTPGYIAPELLEAQPVTPAADVYALGAILFEILAGEPVHKRGGALASTLTADIDGPARRRPDRAIAPELDAACIAALARDPKQRPATRALADAVQRYLDGDRDLERRRQLAAEQVELARTARAQGHRSRAIRLAGRALALDPDAVDAGELLSSMIVEVPEHVPPEVEANAEAIESELLRQRSGLSMRAYLAIWLTLPMFLFGDITSWVGLVGVFSAANAVAVLHWINLRTGRVPTWGFMLANLVLVVLFSQWVGALLLTPLLISALIVAFASRPRLARRPAVALVWGLAAFFLPVLLEQLGVLPHTFSYGANGLASWGNLIDNRTTAGFVMALLGAAALIVLTGRFAIGITQARLAAQRHVQIQAWQLRQLLPRARTIPSDAVSTRI
jgi:serine/threonine-protein kinase